MLYLKAEEFQIQNLYNQAKQGIKILGRKFVLGEWLSRQEQELAKRKCRTYLDSNVKCVLIEFMDRYALYLYVDNNQKEKFYQHTELQQSLQSIVKNEIETKTDKNQEYSGNNGNVTAPFEELGTISTFAQLSQIVENLAQNLDFESQEQFRRIIEQRLVTDRKAALVILQKAFQKAVGPIADLIYQDVISECDRLQTFSDFYNLFERLAEAIDEVEYQQQFRQVALQRLIFKGDVALEIVKQALHQSVGPIAETIYQDVINNT